MKINELIFIIVSAASVSVSGQNLHVIDSLQNELRTTTDTTEVYVLYDIFREYANTNTDSARLYIGKALSMAVLTGDSLAITKMYYGRGWIERRSEDFKNALKDYEKALAIARRNNLTRWEIYVLNDLALIHTSIANYDKALDYNFQSLELRENIDDSDQISIALNNIGLIYLQLTDYEKALRYFKRSFDIKMENGIKYGLDLCLINIGFCYNGLNRVDDAIAGFEQALGLCKPNCTDERLMVLSNGLGDSFLKAGRLGEAEEQYKSAIASARVRGSIHYEAISLTGLASVFMAKKEFTKAISFLDESQVLIRDSDLNEDILENYELYGEVYTSQGDFIKAADYQSRYIQLNKRMYGGKLIKNILGIQSEYEERKNLKVLKAKDQLIILQESQSQMQRIIIVISIILLLLLIGLAMLLWKMVRMKNNTNLLLDQKVRSRTRELEESYKQLERVSLEQQESMHNLNYRMRSSMATLKGITEVAKKDIEDPKGLNYISRIELEAEKLNQASSKN